MVILPFQFIAVAAHPPGSSYHKLGCPLTGRGIVQIWSLLNVMGSDEQVPSVQKSKQKRKNAPTIKDKSMPPNRPRGRPRKNPLPVVPRDNNFNRSQTSHVFTIQCPEKTSELNSSIDEVSETAHSSAVQIDSSRKWKSDSKESASLDENNYPSLMDEDEENRCYSMKQCSSRNNSATQEMAADDNSLDISPVISYFPKDVALPRLVLCLAHNGKVAWDVKWRPTYNEQESKCTRRMGYLAMVLGNGSLEVYGTRTSYLFFLLLLMQSLPYCYY